MKRAALYGIVIVIIALIVAKPMMSRMQKRKPAEAKTPGISVQVAYARMGSMASAIEVSGDMKALESVILSAKASGRVASVPYREGDFVREGAVVVQQDTSDLQAQVRQAEAGLLAARARLSQASTSAGLSDEQVEAQVAQAQAALDAARANLRMTRKGARSQEIAAAEAAVAAAKASFRNAEANRNRLQDLHRQGALSQQQMDLAEMQYDVAKAQYESAQQQLSLVKAGAREEQIEAAQKQVDQAEEAFRIAKANRAQKGLRLEDINSAKAGVSQAEAALVYARQQLINAYIATPISGTVSRRQTEPGQMANPGTPLMEVVALDTVYFEASVSEMDIDRVKVGQPVKVTVDALPGRKFMGSVRKILPTADPKSRQFTVRIEVANRSHDLKPGMFARGSIEIARHKNTIIIPKDALVPNGNGYAVYAVVDSTARLWPVTLGFQNREEVEVLSGVSPSDQLVVVGQDKLSDGVKVNVAD